ncbi:unnamed protein product [Oikopleura dioica]|uniref:Uncharacterized protein n=1 Tax=Oikopleura dioica TaxID=34765 RepID=E4XBI4_OIKDI|nr:unnamed protein product [Oikopleura dioica]
MKYSTKIVKVTAQTTKPVLISVSQQSQSEEETRKRLSRKVCSSSGNSKELTAEQVHLLVSSTASLAYLAGMTWCISDPSSPIAMSATI